MAVVYTSITFSYLNRARVLLDSLKKFHPDWKTVLVISDKAPKGFSFDKEFDDYTDIIFLEELFDHDITDWITRHNLVELCTAVKGQALVEIMKKYPNQKYLYLDPDIALFSSLDPLIEHLDQYNILLTPHQLDPNYDDYAIRDNEISSLIHGTYNLGFYAVNSSDEAKRFAQWWARMLYSYCIDDKVNGLFVDQKWCDLVPAFFDKVNIIRDPGYNVASWNLSTRTLSFDSRGNIMVNDRFPLRFFHFTKLGKVGLIMLERYAKDNIEVYEIWKWYEREVKKYSDPKIPEKYWYFNR